MSRLIPAVVRRPLGKVKREILSAIGDSAHIGGQAYRVLCSSYPCLLFDIRLEDKFQSRSRPIPSYVGASDGYVCMAIGDLRFHWPQDADRGGIGYVYREVFDPPSINPHVYEFNSICMEPGSWVIDAGASEGFFVHYALMRGCNVIAVEPSPLFACGLRRTFQAQIAEGRVSVVEGAIGDFSGPARLSPGGADVFGSHLDEKGSTQVRMYTLDEIVESQRIGHLSFVKVDIEGGETHILEGARSILRDYRPNLSIAVYHAERTGLLLKDQLNRVAPEYRVRFRGVWLRNSDRPRPYMLMARHDRP